LLRSGELLHHASFSLRESMSALEVGDAKMDATVHVAAPGGTLSVDGALRSGLVLPGEQLSLFQQLEVVDELLAAEVTWLSQGASLAHTVYTCVYLHRLDLLAGCPRLEAFVLLALKSVELVRSVVLQADIHAEEDFYYNAHGLLPGAREVPQNFRNNTSTAIPTPSRPEEADDGAAAIVDPRDQPLYLGRSIDELLQRFDREHAALQARIKELHEAERAAAASGGAAAVASPAASAASISDVQWGPADAETSSELHLLCLLESRFSFRRAWYMLHLGLQRPPYALRSNMSFVRTHEATIMRSLEVMQRSARGSSEREQEVLRRQTEEAYERDVSLLLQAHAEALRADPSAPAPVFPKKPSPNLPPRELTFGFSHKITTCLVQCAPPRHVSLLHRKDALAMLQDFMHHYALLHGLPGLLNAPPATWTSSSDAPSASVGGGLLELLGWFAQWHRLGPNIILRSHVWLWVQKAAEASALARADAAGPEARAQLDQGVPVEPATDLFAWLDPAVAPQPLAPAHPAQSGQKVSEAPLPGHHLNTMELLVRSHVSLCGSVERMALNALELESSWKRSPETRPRWDPATAPMSYSFFLERTQAPLLNLLRTLLECPASYRRHTLAASTGAAFVNDWNILTADARAVDGESAPGGFWPYLHAEEALVDIPPALSANAVARQTHPSLLYPFNGYALLLDLTSSFVIAHLLSGLEDGLFHSVKEVPVVLWCLEHALNLRLQSRNQCWRNRSDLITLQRKPPSEAAIAALNSGAAASAPAAGKKKGGKQSLPAKIPLPSIPPRSRPPWNITYVLAEAQQYICRGLIQLIEGLKMVRVPTADSDGSSSSSAGSLVIVPVMPPELADTWYTHRFSELNQLTNPPGLRFADFHATLSQFRQATVPPPPPSASSGAPSSAAAGAGSEQHVASIMTMASNSLFFAKQELSRASSEIKTAAAIAAAIAAQQAPQDDGSSNNTAAPSSSVSPLSVHADFVRSLLHVCVSNTMLPLTYKKSVAAASAANKKLKLTLRWEPQAGTAYTPLHSARLVPFPILQLQQVDK
jgi:hypothetical protein